MLTLEKRTETNITSQKVLSGRTSLSHFPQVLLAIMIALTLSSCGGGNSGSGTPTSTPAMCEKNSPNIQILSPGSGSMVASPVEISITWIFPQPVQNPLAKLQISINNTIYDISKFAYSISSDGITVLTFAKLPFPPGSHNIVALNLLTNQCTQERIAVAQPTPQWTIGHSGTTADLYDVTWGNNEFVAVGSGGTILTSPDGINWIVQYSGTPNNLYSVAYGACVICRGGYTFIAVGDNGIILASPNGITWTSQMYDMSSYRANLFGVEPLKGLGFLAFGSNGANLVGKMFTNHSNHVVVFEEYVPRSNSNLRSSAEYDAPIGSPICLVVGDNGTILESDCEGAYAVSEPHSGTSNNLADITSCDQVSAVTFVAVGGNGTILTSHDESTWTPQHPGTSNNLNSIVSSHCQRGTPSLYVAVGGNGTILASTYGYTWTPQTSGTTLTLFSVAYASAKDEFIAVGQNGEILTSLSKDIRV